MKRHEVACNDQYIDKVEQNGQYNNKVSCEKFAFYFTHRKTQLL